MSVYYFSSESKRMYPTEHEAQVADAAAKLLNDAKVNVLVDEFDALRKEYLSKLNKLREEYREPFQAKLDQIRKLTEDDVDRFNQ